MPQPGDVSIWVGYASTRGAVAVSAKLNLKVVAAAPVAGPVYLNHMQGGCTAVSLALVGSVRLLFPTMVLLVDNGTNRFGVIHTSWKTLPTHIKNNSVPWFATRNVLCLKYDFHHNLVRLTTSFQAWTMGTP